MINNNPRIHFTAPDWAILGVNNEDGTYTVYGTIDLVYARIERELQAVAFAEPRRSRDGYAMRAHCENVAEASGATYQEALANLFAIWDPNAKGAEPERALNPATPELEA